MLPSQISIFSALSLLISKKVLSASKKMKGSWNSINIIPVTLSFLFIFIYNFEDILGAPVRHLCLSDQRDALLQFKNEFESKERTSLSLTCTPKTKSWTNNNDCCKWEGITCNTKSGEVMGLDLSRSCISGQFHSNSSLQNLKFLTTLTLSYNYISGRIPSLVGNFPHLNSLDLSHNHFTGQFPSSIGNLSNLTTIDLSFNYFTGQIPYSIRNLYRLKALYLDGNKFNGEIPSSFGNLNQLTRLSVSYNNLYGQIPIALVNLTRLSYLSLSKNKFTGMLPPNFTSLSNLSSFYASDNAFSGTLPSSLFTIPSLTRINLSHNQLNGTLEFGNISSPSNLQFLELYRNNFIGPLPRSISKLTNLKYLDLSDVNTQGPVDFSIFTHLKSLQDLHLANLNTTNSFDLNDILSSFKELVYLNLAHNHVSVTKHNSVSGNHVSQLIELDLTNCGITTFPELLRNQRGIVNLDLSFNKIKGQVPRWLWTLPTLQYLNLCNNALTGFEIPMKPGLSSSFGHLFGTDNNFTGEIPSFICAFPSLISLDLSINNFNGSIPPCIRNLNRTLSLLNLGQNRLHGHLPKDIYRSLRSLNVGNNQLVGKLPRSLIHSSTLEFLNVGNNRMNDTFPFWLSSLQKLQVLVLRSNAFHGPIHQASFPKLRIIDISDNHFSGTLPSDYFVSWSVISRTSEDLAYVGDALGYYRDTLVLTNKGVHMELTRINKNYKVLDFSGNKLEGEIPRSIGLLKELLMLSLSNNAFSGHIPSSIGNLTALESLDVSQNQLSGAIPQELGKLSFLSYMNFSHNQLSGLVPGGTQFRTQECSSFQYNQGLYGPSFDEACKDIHMPTSEHSQTPEPEKEDEEVVSWIAAAIGFIPGIALGITLGYIFASYKPECFMNSFARNKRRSGNTTTQ